MKKQDKPIDFTTRKKITELSRTLPKLPFLIQVGNKLSFQEISQSRVVAGNDLIKQDPELKINGESIDSHKNYISKGFSIRFLNHEVELTKAYKKSGDSGLFDYINYCKGLEASLNRQLKKEEDDQGK
jgi:hypothetical protein